jgi:hypothetical protein
MEPGVDYDVPWEYGRGWPKLPDMSGMYDADAYGREFAAPTSVDPGSMFSLGRESQNVEDHRGQINNVWAGMGLGGRALTEEWDSLGSITAPPAVQDDPPENRHANAVDGFISRLQAYAPSRASYINPQSIRSETALDMSAYYKPVREAHDSEYARNEAMQRALDGLMRPRRRPEEVDLGGRR